MNTTNNQPLNKAHFAHRNTYSMHLVAIVTTEAGSFGLSHEYKSMWVEFPEYNERFDSLDLLRKLYAEKVAEHKEVHAAMTELGVSWLEKHPEHEAKFNEAMAEAELKHADELLLIETAAAALADGTLESIINDILEAEENTRPQPKRAAVKCTGPGQCGKCSGTGEYVGWIENGRKRSNTGFTCWACNGTGCRRKNCKHK